MAKYRVLVTDYAWEDLEIEASILAQADAEIVLPQGTSEEELVTAAAGCDAILTNWAQTTSKVIAAAENCRIVSRMGIGLDNIDVDYCTQNEIRVTNIPDYCVIEVAEHALAMLLAMARKIAFYHHQTQAGTYHLQAGTRLKRIEGQTLGIIGLGHIGTQLAKLANGVGLRVLAYSRSPKDIEGVSQTSFENVLRNSDYVSLHVPLTIETRNLVGAAELSQMKNSAFLINTARGGLIDHDALAVSLESGEIAGAALDVQVPEPPDLSQPPYNDPRVIVTPHAAFVSAESLQDLRTRAATQVAQQLKGERPENIVNSV